MLMLVCILTINVFASVNTGDVLNGNVVCGSVYINAKTSSVYAETNANSSALSSLDYVSVAAAGDSKTNIGLSYMNAWVSVTGTFSGLQSASGTVCRSVSLSPRVYYIAYGSTSANVS